MEKFLECQIVRRKQLPRPNCKPRLKKRAHFEQSQGESARSTHMSMGQLTEQGSKGKCIGRYAPALAAL
jgi:hypothetical protein